MIFAADPHFGKEVAGLAAWLEQQVLSDREKVLVVPGDLTKDAKEPEYQAAGRFLGRLRTAGVRLVITPGNHDFGRWIGGRYLPSRQQRSCYQEYVFPKISTQHGILAGRDYDFVLPIGDDVFVVLRSTHKDLLIPNRIRGEQIRWAADVLGRKKLPGTARLHLVTHRSLWQEAGEKLPDMRRRERLEKALVRELGFYSYVHGNNHGYHFARRPTPATRFMIQQLSVPSAMTRTADQEPGIVRWSPGQGDPAFVPFKAAEPVSPRVSPA